MSYSCNNNQSYFLKEGHTASKVLAPPGGGSQINLAWDDGSQQNNNPNSQNGGGYSSAMMEKKRRNQQEVTPSIGSPAQSRQPQPLANYGEAPSYTQPDFQQQQRQQQQANNITGADANHHHGHLNLGVSGNKFANGGNQVSSRRRITYIINTLRAQNLRGRLRGHVRFCSPPLPPLLLLHSSPPPCAI